MIRRSVHAVLGAVVLLGALALPAHGEAIGEGSKETNSAVLSPLVITALASPDPVLGSDGKVHVAYELFIVNQSSTPTTLTSVEVLDPAKRDAVVDTIDGTSLESFLLRTGGNEGTTFAPSTSGYLFVDVQLVPGNTVPRTLLHHVVLTAGGAAPQTIAFDGVTVPVGRQRAVVVAPPLRGGGWVVGNGCCDPPTAHRAATLSINGTARAPERFAIDFVRLGSNRATAQGDPGVTGSYGYFGDEIHSVAPGRVVGLQDGLAEQIPGALPSGQTVQTAGGNYVVVDIGQGRYAFYAHMQPGSLKVKVGDRVTTGQVLGLLGNTGNSDAPHLHFHIMDGPSPLLSNGLPFVFTKFTGDGVVTDEQALENGQVTTVDGSALTGTHTKEMPLNLDIVGFGT